MLAKRIIPCLDVRDGVVVKGVQFKNHVILGDIIELAQRYRDEGADELVFYVKDSGIGIPGDQHDQIFEHFRQGENNLSRKFGGAGLGLAIAKDLSSLLGCKLWLESEVDYGSVFYFSIKYESKNI